jgi:pimeloyl-ACP methyl ester carboxylesterase
MSETELAERSSRIDSSDPLAEARRMIDVGGRRLAMTSRGHGDPTVILETGLGAESADWSAVQRAIAPLARVLRYDRAGRGASDAASGQRSAHDLVEDLELLLRRAAITPPYVLVGHSFGGLLVRLFARRNPSKVAGLVLVDSMHEDQFDVFGPLFPPPAADEPPALTEIRRFWTGAWRDPRSTQEGLDLVLSCAQGRAVTTLGDVPLHVLTAGTFLNQPLVPQSQRVPLQLLWDEMQARLLALSSNATQWRVESSGHFMQREAPQSVVEAIRQTLERVRRR